MLLKRKNPKKPVAPWRKNILDHHKDRPSSADRAEFDRKVLAELIKEADGRCQVCKSAPDTTTHHVMPRGRRTGVPGRGVKTNGLRCCWPCHDRIQTDERELQHWIEIYRQRHGDRFWYDEQDWEEHRRREAKEQAAEEERRQRAEELSELFAMLQKSTKLTTAEKRRLSEISDRHIAVLVGVLRRSMGTGVPNKFGYGHFED